LSSTTIVSVDARGQNGALPAVGRQLESVQLFEDRAEAVDAAQPMRGVHVLPREQEPHEIRRADRLDFRAQPVERVAMDAGQQPPVAPLNRSPTIYRGARRARREKSLFCVLGALCG